MFFFFFFFFNRLTQFGGWESCSKDRTKHDIEAPGRAPMERQLCKSDIHVSLPTPVLALGTKIHSPASLIGAPSDGHINIWERHPRAISHLRNDAKSKLQSFSKGSQTREAQERMAGRYPSHLCRTDIRPYLMQRPCRGHLQRPFSRQRTLQYWPSMNLVSGTRGFARLRDSGILSESNKRSARSAIAWVYVGWIHISNEVSINDNCE